MLPATLKPKVKRQPSVLKSVVSSVFSGFDFTLIMILLLPVQLFSLVTVTL